MSLDQNLGAWFPMLSAAGMVTRNNHNHEEEERESEVVVAAAGIGRKVIDFISVGGVLLVGSVLVNYILADRLHQREDDARYNELKTALAVLKNDVENINVRDIDLAARGAKQDELLQRQLETMSTQLETIRKEIRDHEVGSYYRRPTSRPDGDGR